MQFSFTKEEKDFILERLLEMTTAASQMGDRPLYRKIYRTMDKLAPNNLISFLKPLEVLTINELSKKTLEVLQKDIIPKLVEAKKEENLEKAKKLEITATSILGKLNHEKK